MKVKVLLTNGIIIKDINGTKKARRSGEIMELCEADAKRFEVLGIVAIMEVKEIAPEPSEEAVEVIPEVIEEVKVKRGRKSTKRGNE